MSSFIEKVVVVHVDFDIWSGKMRFDEEDYLQINKGNNVVLPNAQQGTLGDKKVIDSDHLRIFNQLKFDVMSCLKETGLPFAGAFIIPATKVVDIRHLLKQYKVRFDDEVAAFVNNYPKYRSEWDQQNQDMSFLAAPPVDKIGKRFKLQYHLYKMTGVLELGEDDTQVEIEKEISYSFLLDINRMANVLMRDFVWWRPYGVPELVTGIEKLHAKIRSLAFLNPKVSGLAGLIESEVLLHVLPEETLKGRQFINAGALLYMLASPMYLEAYLEGKTTVAQMVPFVEDSINRAIQVYADLKNMQISGRKLTPAYVKRICTGEVPMPTSAEVANETSKSESSKKRSTTKSRKTKWTKKPTVFQPQAQPQDPNMALDLDLSLDLDVPPVEVPMRRVSPISVATQQSVSGTDILNQMLGL